jgi:predicted ATPase
MASAQSMVGRDSELASIGAFLDAVGGQTGALFIDGETGVGKSSLWRETVRAAEERGFLVLRCQPTESESDIGFAGLIDLLGPWVDEFPAELPEPQRRALDAALMRGASDDVVGQGAVAVAVVAVLRELARSAPTLIAIDDPQWLDTPTSRAIGFALRRLEVEPIKVVVTGRAGSLAETLLRHLEITRLAVAPLSLGATYQLVRAKLSVTLPRPALVRIHEASAGNPFFSVELARAWTHRSEDGLVGHLPVKICSASA